MNIKFVRFSSWMVMSILLFSIAAPLRGEMDQHKNNDETNANSLAKNTIISLSKSQNFQPLITQVNSLNLAQFNFPQRTIKKIDGLEGLRNDTSQEKEKIPVQGPELWLEFLKLQVDFWEENNPGKQLNFFVVRVGVNEGFDDGLRYAMELSRVLHRPVLVLPSLPSPITTSEKLQIPDLSKAANYHLFPNTVKDQGYKVLEYILNKGHLVEEVHYFSNAVNMLNAESESESLSNFIRDHHEQLGLKRISISGGTLDQRNRHKLEEAFFPEFSSIKDVPNELSPIKDVTQELFGEDFVRVVTNNMAFPLEDITTPLMTFKLSRASLTPATLARHKLLLIIKLYTMKPESLAEEKLDKDGRNILDKAHKYLKKGAWVQSGSYLIKESGLYNIPSSEKWKELYKKLGLEKYFPNNVDSNKSSSRDKHPKRLSRKSSDNDRNFGGGEPPKPPSLKPPDPQTPLDDDDDQNKFSSGGIDFSSVQLNFLSENPGPNYAFGAALRGTPNKSGQKSVDIETASQLAWDSFFVWLALPSNTFWVNLNPNEPERIINSELGKTDAGRIMLEADLQMKKTVAKLLHPDSKLGKAFWDKVYAYAGARGLNRTCFGFRQWIVPGEVKVWTNNTSIYIVKATLDVKMESDYMALKGETNPMSVCPPDADPELQSYAESLFRKMILPEVIKQVNTAPEYRDIRSIFNSRIIAEWYKTQHRTTGQAAFASLIGQGNAAKWYSKTPWQPKDTFNRYVKSVKQGEFKITRTTKTTQGNYMYTEVRTYFYGGVDLTRLLMPHLRYEELLAQEPAAEQKIFDALLTPNGYWDGKEAWFGELYIASGPTFVVPSGWWLYGVGGLVLSWLIWKDWQYQKSLKKAKQNRAK